MSTLCNHSFIWLTSCQTVQFYIILNCRSGHQIWNLEHILVSPFPCITTTTIFNHFKTLHVCFGKTSCQSFIFCRLTCAELHQRDATLFICRMWELPSVVTPCCKNQKSSTFEWRLLQCDDIPAKSSQQILGRNRAARGSRLRRRWVQSRVKFLGDDKYNEGFLPLDDPTTGKVHSWTNINPSLTYLPLCTKNHLWSNVSSEISWVSRRPVSVSVSQESDKQVKAETHVFRRPAPRAALSHVTLHLVWLRRLSGSSSC